MMVGFGYQSFVYVVWFCDGVVWRCCVEVEQGVVDEFVVGCDGVVCIEFGVCEELLLVYCDGGEDFGSVIGWSCDYVIICGVFFVDGQSEGVQLFVWQFVVFVGFDFFELFVDYICLLFDFEDFGKNVFGV